MDTLNLVKICPENQDYYKSFEAVFEQDLSKYQSRICPRKESTLIKWYYIEYQQRYIGSIWLEKEQNSTFAVLGIFIADSQYRGNGLGKQAIRKIIDLDAASMDITEILLNAREENIRAINCYASVGFKKIKSYTKDNQVQAIQMGLTI